MNQSMDPELASALNAVDTDETPKTYPTEFTTQVTGVRLKLRPVPSHLMAAAIRGVKKPEIPKWHNPDRNRDEPNPLDPQYLEDIEDWESRRGLMTSYCLLSMGTEPIMPLPEGVHAPDSKEWSAPFIEELHVEIPKSGRARYVEWLRLYVLASDQDFNDLLEAIQRAGFKMPTEQAVLDAAESFRDSKGEPTPINGQVTPT